MQLNEETKKNRNKLYLNRFGMTYDEFTLLEFNKQQELIEEYKKNHPKIKKGKGNVAFISSDDLTFLEFQKGKKVLTSSGYRIAGETIEENKQRRDKREEEVFGEIDKEESNIKVGISSGPSFMKSFLEQIRSGELKIETLPQVEIEESFTGTKEEIEKELELYQNLLDTKIIEEATKEEKNLVKKIGTKFKNKW